MTEAKNGFCAGLTYEQALHLAEKNGEEVVPTFCAMCGPSPKCRIFAFKKNGKMTRVMGAAEGEINRGSLCAKALAAPAWVHSEERLTTPLVRTGERGEGRFKPVSWEEAIALTAKRLLEQKEKYGPESLAILSPGWRDYKEISLRFLAVHGSPNHAHSGICALQCAFGSSYTLGARPRCDYKNSNMIIYWGKQPFYSGPATSSSRNLIAAKKRHARVIAVKPSMEPDSALADRWLPVRPGTDAALALSMLHVIIKENLIDHDFVQKWCYGYPELRDHVKKYSPDWAEAVTGIPKETIISTAREYASEKAACIDMGNGLEHSASSCDAIRAICMMIAITGHLDRPGCNIIPGKPDVPGLRSLMRPDLYTKEMVEKLNAPEFPRPFQPFIEGPSSAYYKTIESILTGKPYPVKTLLALGTQPTVSNRGTRNVLEALKKVDFFVVGDVMKTAEMAYADVVFPIAASYETNHPLGMQGNTVIPHNQVISPPGQCRSNHEFYLDLAVAMGYGKDFWNGDVDAMENYRLEPLGITVEELRRHPMGFRINGKGPEKPFRYEKYDEIFSKKSTRLSGDPYLPQHKVALYNTTFEKEGYPPMPEWREPPESLTGSEELSGKYPLLFSDYHTTKNFTSAWLQNVPALRELTPDPVLHIHPKTAGERGIANGDWVRVESPHGWLKVKAEYYEGISPDVVMMAHGWWRGCKELGLEEMSLTDGGANANLLYSTEKAAYDPLVTAMSSQTLVEVKKYE